MALRSGGTLPLAIEAGWLSVANLAPDAALILPLYRLMTEEDQDYVIENLKDVSRG